MEKQIEFEEPVRSSPKGKPLHEQSIQSIAGKIVSNLLMNKLLQRVATLVLIYIAINGIFTIFTSLTNFLILCSLLIAIFIENKIDLINKIKKWINKSKNVPQ